MTLGDNSLKVVRVDNNKTVLHANSINLSQSSYKELQSYDNTLVVPHDH